MSARDRSRETVIEQGTATQKSPAALAARIPLGESSRASTSRAGIPIASSSDRQWVEDLLEHLGIGQGWAHVACADGDRERAKPDPALYLEALDAIGIPARDVLALEDSPNGVLAAKGAGLFCVAVPCALTASLDLSAADVEVPSLAGIKLEGLLSLFK